MILREAQEKDLEAIACIEAQSIQGDFWKLNDFRSCMNNKSSLLMVAEADGNIAGYEAFYVAADEAELPTIAVSPEYRGRGLASLMLLEGMTLVKAAGAVNLFLEVRESNVPALKLYDRTGFKEVGRRKAFYVDPVEDALLMQKCL